ncbi:MAG: hypothetical protein ACRDNF_10275, partial [Streptosporangiaceae bacterium]
MANPVVEPAAAIRDGARQPLPNPPNVVWPAMMLGGAIPVDYGNWRQRGISPPSFCPVSLK